MNMLLRSFFAVLLASGTALLAQREARFLTNSDRAWPTKGAAKWSLEEGGAVRCSRFDVLRSASALTSISSAGGLFVLNETDALVCGMTSTGEGVIERWSLGPSALSLADIRVDAGLDFVGVVFDEGSSKLFALDAVSSTLLCASWSPETPLSTVNWQPFATPTEVPELAQASGHTLSSFEAGYLSLVEYPSFGTLRGVTVPVASTPASGSPIISGDGDCEVYAIPSESSEGGYSVAVKGLAGVPFEIVRVSTGSVIGTGVGAGVENPVVVATSQPLVLGDRYVARVVGQPAPLTLAFECVRRYGESDSLADGTAMRPFFYQMGAASGQIVRIQINLRRDPQPIDVAYDGYLLVAIRDPLDPVAAFGSGYLLSPLLMLPVRGWIAADAICGVAALDVPVPSGMNGTVFLVQYVLWDGLDWRLSQVYGSAIKP